MSVFKLIGKNISKKSENVTGAAVDFNVSKDSTGLKVIDDGSKYTVDNHNKEHSGVSIPDTMSKNVLEQSLKDGSGYINKVTGINTYDNSKVTYEGVTINGTTYDRETLVKIIPNGDGKDASIIPGKDDIERNAKEGWTNVYYHQAPPKVPDEKPIIPYYPEEDPYIPPPPKPPPPNYPDPPKPPDLEIFDAPEPTFSADLQRAHRFIYFMGLDKVQVKSVIQEKNSIRITKSIYVGACEWIELEVKDFTPEKGAIEYAIIDGEDEVSLLPNSRNLSENEKIFPNLPLRFSIDDSAPVIKKDGTMIEKSLEEVHNKRDGIYSISYKTINSNKYLPKNDAINLKITLRLYDEESEAPFVDDIKVRIYGGESTLWQDNI